MGCTTHGNRSRSPSLGERSLFQRYQEEVLAMPDKLEEFTRETIDRLLRELPVEKRLEGLSVEERLEGLPVDKLLEGVPVEKLLEGIPVKKRLEGMSSDELLAALSPQMREALARRLEPDGSLASPE
jgi:hypothetical protein